MINVITINLLAEKPYRKYGKVAFIDFSKRSERFYLQITKLMPDVMLLQEVDMLWLVYLESLLSDKTLKEGRLSSSFFFLVGLVR